jgi:hypothetical protein
LNPFSGRGIALSSSRWLVACHMVLLATLLPVANVLGQADEALAEAAVAKAQQELASVYDAVLEAETIGVNVSGFVDRLNVAAGLLADAEVLRRYGDFSEAVLFADAAKESLQGLFGDVKARAEMVAMERAQAFAWTAALSIVGVILVVTGGWFGWGYVRAWYVRRLWGLKPEVVEDDESR